MHEVQLRGAPFVFKTDSGVFSKHALDFGTQLLIDEFDFPKEPGPILDVGCGYGPIGLALAKSDPKRVVILVDINERALQLAKENQFLNEINNVQILKSNLFESVPKKDYSAIVSNPPIRAGKKVVYTLFRQAYEFLNERGQLWIVIQKKQGAPSAIKELDSLFQQVEVITRKKGYFILLAKKG